MESIVDSIVGTQLKNVIFEFRLLSDVKDCVNDLVSQVEADDKDNTMFYFCAIDILERTFKSRFCSSSRKTRFWKMQTLDIVIYNSLRRMFELGEGFMCSGASSFGNRFRAS